MLFIKAEISILQIMLQMLVGDIITSFIFIKEQLVRIWVLSVLSSDIPVFMEV
jgi:hypothetical protein